MHKKRQSSDYGILAIIVVLAGGAIQAPASDQSTDAQGKWRMPAGLTRAVASESVKVRSVNVSSERVTLQYTLPCPRIRLASTNSGVESVEVLAGNAPVDVQPGLPVLPLIPVTIAIPAGCKVKDVTVVGGNAITLPGRHVVRHGGRQRPLSEVGIERDATLRDETVYGSDEPWPGTLYRTVGVQKSRGTSLLLLNLLPVQYRALSGIITYQDTLTVEVATEPDTTPQSVMRRPDPVNPLDQRVDNPESLDGAAVSSKGIGPTGAIERSTTSSSGPFQYVVRRLRIGQSYRMSGS
jgi:hypothetical protein